MSHPLPPNSCLADARISLEASAARRVSSGGEHRIDGEQLGLCGRTPRGHGAKSTRPGDSLQEATPPGAIRAHSAFWAHFSLDRLHELSVAGPRRDGSPALSPAISRATKGDTARLRSPRARAIQHLQQQLRLLQPLAHNAQQRLHRVHQRAGDRNDDLAALSGITTCGTGVACATTCDAGGSCAITCGPGGPCSLTRAASPASSAAAVRAPLWCLPSGGSACVRRRPPPRTLLPAIGAPSALRR